MFKMETKLKLWKIKQIPVLRTKPNQTPFLDKILNFTDWKGRLDSTWSTLQNDTVPLVQCSIVLWLSLEDHKQSLWQNQLCSS